MRRLGMMLAVVGLALGVLLGAAGNAAAGVNVTLTGHFFACDGFPWVQVAEDYGFVVYIDTEHGRLGPSYRADFMKPAPSVPSAASEQLRLSVTCLHDPDPARLDELRRSAESVQLEGRSFVIVQEEFAPDRTAAAGRPGSNADAPTARIELLELRRKSTAAGSEVGEVGIGLGLAMDPAALETLTAAGASPREVMLGLLDEAVVEIVSIGAVRRAEEQAEQWPTSDAEAGAGGAQLFGPQEFPRVEIARDYEPRPLPAQLADAAEDAGVDMRIYIKQTPGNPLGPTMLSIGVQRVRPESLSRVSARLKAKDTVWFKGVRYAVDGLVDGVHINVTERQEGQNADNLRLMLYRVIADTRLEIITFDAPIALVRQRTSEWPPPAQAMLELLDQAIVSIEE